MSTALGTANMKRMLSERLFEMRADPAAGMATLAATLPQGGGGVLRTGESSISSPHPSSLRSSTSHRRLAAFLVRFAGGGDNGSDVAGVGCRVGRGAGESCFGGGAG